MTYQEVVEKAKRQERNVTGKVTFIPCDVWENGNQINLWTYWQGYQLYDIDEKGVDILLVGQDWGAPYREGNRAVLESIRDIQNDVAGAFYGPTQSPTDKRLAKMFTAFGKIDINSINPGMRLFFTNYSLGYRSGSETGDMTKTIMKLDSELFDDLVEAIKPKIIICLGMITYEMVVGSCVKDFSKKLQAGEPCKGFYPKNNGIPVYGVAHPGSRGLQNVGGDEAIMKKAWIKIATEYYAKFGGDFSPEYQPDYDSASSHWIERDRDSVHMEPAALKEKIEAFVDAHNTCALATASRDMVRNTPIEYNYVDSCFYFFSEGGLKFKGLKENKNVGMAIFEPYGGFGQLKSLQVQGVASMVEPFSEEYLKLMEHKKIPVEAMKKLPQAMNLIKVVPTSYDYLDSDLKKDGFGSRQHLNV